MRSPHSAFRVYSSAGLSIVSLALILACGGGGGGNNSGITIYKDQPTISASVFQGQGTYQNSTITPTVLAGTYSPVPAALLYPYVTASAPGFVALDSTVDIYNNGTFSASFTPDSSLAPGTYPGTISVKVFQDAAMTIPIAVTGGSVPFTVTVTRPLVVNVLYQAGSLNGVSPTNNNGSINIPDGTTIEFDSINQIPFTVMYSSGAVGLPAVSNIVTSQYTWTAKLSMTASYADPLSLTVVAADGSPQNVTVTVNVQSID